MQDNASQENQKRNPFHDVPIELLVSVGKARPLIRDLLAMDVATVLPLDKGIDDKVELYAGGKLVAEGHLEELEGEPSGRLGVRLTEVMSLRSAGPE